MENYMEITDRLLEKDCYIIDFLPETVSKNAKGQFFDVEYYLLNSQKYCSLKERFVGV